MRPASSGWIEVRRNGRLLFFFDPARDLIEIKRKGEQPVLIDLRRLRRETQAAHSNKGEGYGQPAG